MWVHFLPFSNLHSVGGWEKKPCPNSNRCILIRKISGKIDWRLHSDGSTFGRGQRSEVSGGHYVCLYICIIVCVRVGVSRQMSTISVRTWITIPMYFGADNTLRLFNNNVFECGWAAEEEERNTVEVVEVLLIVQLLHKLCCVM